MGKPENRSSVLWYTIVFSSGILAFVIFKEVLFLIFGALLSVLILVFKK